MRCWNCAVSSPEFFAKRAHLLQRKTRLQNRFQLDLAFQEKPPVILTDEERRQLIAALATLLLSAVRRAADE